MSELIRMLKHQSHLHKISGANALSLLFINAANKIEELEEDVRTLEQHIDKLIEHNRD